MPIPKRKSLLTEKEIRLASAIKDYITHQGLKLASTEPEHVLKLAEAFFLSYVGFTLSSPKGTFVVPGNLVKLKASFSPSKKQKVFGSKIMQKPDRVKLTLSVMNRLNEIMMEAYKSLPPAQQGVINKNHMGKHNSKEDREEE